jgi:anhydro-N-acetylmuramic acid kinase
MDRFFIGIMSGTSVDGIDTVLTTINDHSISIVATYTHPFSTVIKDNIEKLCLPGTNEIELLGETDTELGKLYALAVNKLLNIGKIEHDQVTAIGSHGQTIRHRPSQASPFTLQIGDPNQISYLTGITTVADFRRKDMAAGGQGAPLLPIFHQYIFQSPGSHKAVVNIGGMANISILAGNSHQQIIGYDTGPGNRLLDGWCQKSLNTSYDHAGQWAKSGTVIKPMLNQMLKADYFAMPYPKSTGRESFNQQWLDKYIKPDYAAVDIQRTLVELTAITISDAIFKSSTHCDEIILCGGGSKNLFIIERIRHHSPCTNITTSASYGIDPQWVEATAFAWFAMRTFEGLPGNLPSVTGAQNPVVLGGIYPGSNYKP